MLQEFRPQERLEGNKETLDNLNSKSQKTHETSTYTVWKKLKMHEEKIEIISLGLVNQNQWNYKTLIN